MPMLETSSLAVLVKAPIPFRNALLELFSRALPLRLPLRSPLLALDTVPIASLKDQIAS